MSVPVKQAKKPAGPPSKRLEGMRGHRLTAADLTRMCSNATIKHCAAAAFGPHIPGKQGRISAAMVVAVFASRIVYEAYDNERVRVGPLKHFNLKAKNLEQAKRTLGLPATLDLSGGISWKGSVTTKRKAEQAAEPAAAEPVAKRRKVAAKEPIASDDASSSPVPGDAGQSDAE